MRHFRGRKETLIQKGFLRRSPKERSRGSGSCSLCRTGCAQEERIRCVICCEANGEKRQEKRSFGTVTADLLSLADWLRQHDVTHVVMEATGVYWRRCGRFWRASSSCCW